jgi:ectoine hydroxylase-related dioxygenase (phytanoyl-CoA dioxygenase family)
MNSINQGFSIIPSSLSDGVIHQLRETLFQSNAAGERCLLDHPIVRDTALLLKSHLNKLTFLSPASIAVQAITFDKTQTTNWKVAWHQDLMFPFAKRVSTLGFDLPTIKQGIDYARPPIQVLEQLLAVRLHLDDCTETNGPLKISPDTHRAGVIDTSKIADFVKTHGEFTCLAKEGDLLLMHPLILHTSSQATQPKHRRILHIVYHSNMPIEELWHRSI